ncbi:MULTISPECIES: putative phage tail protein [unclassified Haematospirillum]|uniref:putative phage tail protein n=1 Tax=unclassified Haematospirillum TaxID=2622088 RepID=UPI00143C9A69|nr:MULTISPECIES: putative phage tail protein [unclassified Haematospirillum]NKD55983.1 DUF2313 domain-containing protein [Haematospirillum sp. H4890]NKD75290.1 DUF2313 domain-containing protein [Haematospirillum sp. H4485]
MRANDSDYQGLLCEEAPRGLRPPGPAGAGNPQLLKALAPALAALHNRALDLVEEADPSTAFTMLEDQEREWGLPDECSHGRATTLQERRQALLARRRARGGATLAWLQALADDLGYQTTLVEHRPFVCGQATCSESALNGGHAIRRYIRVTVHGPRVTLFRCADSQCLDPLGKIAQAEDLVCRLRKMALAHLDLKFSYEGI